MAKGYIVGDIHVRDKAGLEKFNGCPDKSPGFVDGLDISDNVHHVYII